MLEYLPSDWRQAILVGRILTPDGPTPVVVADGRVRDVSRHAATVSQLLNGWNGDVPAGQDLGTLESLGFTRQFAEAKQPRLLSPFDLQCVKASGVTFAVSAIERVKVRKSYYKRSAISGKMKLKPAKLASAQQLKVRLSVNPLVYEIAERGSLKVGSGVGQFAFTQVSTAGGIIDVTADSTIRTVPPKQILDLLRLVYDQLQRKV